ncbi:acyltransferase [Lysinibacillus sp. fls2-241-R2A-57]|uniref:acyltransferase n=1 Tax=Lysinibacillus sp. fls2-241-R2A-57 TaxID=3040292 RepID=UPI0025551E79|nr:acyltransferase [Lysinibacillus sp. fls2-241-R2A-57]
MSLNKERIDAVKFMRVTAMLLVILIHATGVALSKIPHDSPSYFFYLFLNRFTRFEGSVFVFLSGLTLFYNYESKPFTKQTWSNFYKRRFMFILGPFLIWSIFYELFSYYQGVRVFTDWKTMFTSIVTGGAYYHLYFILILVQLYFLMPLFIYLVKRFWWFKKYLLFIGFAVELAVQSYFEMFDISFTVPLFSIYIASFFFGGWVALHYQSLKEQWSKKQYFMWISCTFLLGIFYTMLYYFRNILGYDEISYMVFKFLSISYMLLSCFVLFKISIYLVHHGGRKLNDFAEHLRIYSFGFYLVHPFILYLLGDSLRSLIPSHIHLYIFMRFILTVIFCYVFIRIMHRLFPRAWFLFGNLPAPERNKTS